MKLWLLTHHPHTDAWENNPKAPSMLVIRAASEQEAREIANDDWALDTDDRSTYWLNPAHAFCRELVANGEHGVLVEGDSWNVYLGMSILEGDE